jgi:hypothetical protein
MCGRLGIARRIRPDSHGGISRRSRRAAIAIGVAAIAALFGFPHSADAQHGTIGVTAVVAPASPVIASLVGESDDTSATVRRVIVRDGEATIATPGVRGRGSSGASSWIITVKAAPLVPAPNREGEPDRPVARVVTCIIAAAA